MTAVLLGVPAAVETRMAIPVGVDFEVWINWLDSADGVTVLQMGTWAAELLFSSGGVGEVVPSTVTNATDPASVGRVTLANTTPNMKIKIPAAVTSTLGFRRIRGVLNVTDGSGSKRRWLEAEVTLDRGTGF